MRIREAFLHALAYAVMADRPCGIPILFAITRYKEDTPLISKKLTINTAAKKAEIKKEIYGHFSEHLGRCIYGGIYVGEDSDIPNTRGLRNDVVAALKDMGIPVLRWPGGCFADEYHWMNGIGPKDKRVTMINTNWGGVTEDNSFGTHEFMDLCEQIGCEPYISGNVGSGTVREMSEWIEYMTSDNVSPMTDLRKANGREKPWHLKYLGIGNENWGCGGFMTPEYYANQYRQFQQFCKDYGSNKLFKVACGPNGGDTAWTEKLMSMLNPMIAGAISLHFYTIPTGNWNDKGSATGFSEELYNRTIRETQNIAPIIESHLKVMDKYDPDHKIGLIVDEWGCWYNVEEGTNPGFLYQQNTMRDAIVASVNLNIFNNRADRIVMANIAQVVNVLQSVVLTEGSKMLRTPTYHVFKMYKPHQGSTLVETKLENTMYAHEDIAYTDISCSASETKDGDLFVTLSNANLHEEYVLDVAIDKAFAKYDARILTGAMGDYNTFDAPDQVIDKAYNGIALNGSAAKITLPPCSVVTVKFTK